MLTTNEQLVMLAISRCGRQTYALAIQEEAQRLHRLQLQQRRAPLRFTRLRHDDQGWYRGAIATHTDFINGLGQDQHIKNFQQFQQGADLASAEVRGRLPAAVQPHELALDVQEVEEAIPVHVENRTVRRVHRGRPRGHGELPCRARRAERPRDDAASAPVVHAGRKVRGECEEAHARSVLEVQIADMAAKDLHRLEHRQQRERRLKPKQMRSVRGQVNIQDLSFTKYVDKSSPNLMKVCCTGRHYDEATLVVRKAGGSPIEYITVTMNEVLVTSVSTGGSGGEDRLTENVTLNFGKVKVSYQPQKKDGSKDGGAIDMTWDIEQNV